MKIKANILTPLLALASCVVITLGAGSQAQAADASGNWTWSRPGRNGGEPQKMSLTLKADGEKLTGTLTSPGRQGGDPVKTEISDGTVKGEDVSFTVSREFNGNKMVAKYNGKLSADSIKGKIATERNGEAQSRDWEAKREAAK